MVLDIIQYKNSLYDELSHFSKGLASNKRLEILDLLLQASKSVDSISRDTGNSVANTSRHLQVLKESHLVASSRNGNQIIYSLASDNVVSLVRTLMKVGERESSEMKYIQKEADNDQYVKTISLEKVRQEIDNIFLLDVRPKDEYIANHILGAINIPLNELIDNINIIPKNKKIIVYCRGRLCANSNFAVKKLNQYGLNAYSLNSSVHDWQEIAHNSDS